MPLYTYRCEVREHVREDSADEPRRARIFPAPQCGAAASRSVAAITEHNSSREKSANFPKRKRYTNW